ncbi:MAG TPA: glyoxalase [Dysgonomonas sp.]|nr:glyoxalase [Dysgonomonas sp.]
MTLQDLSVCFHTDKIQECKDFYVKYFDAEVVFDHSWYVTILFNKERMITLNFMEPQDNEPYYGGGVTLNFYYEDVDAVYEKLIVKTGLKAVAPIEDHDWGDRSFSINDPIGNILYIYSPRQVKKEYADSVKINL